VLTDPKARFAYIATKVFVLAVAALVTWPLAQRVGSKAWIGLAIFGAILAVMTAVVLLSSAGRPSASETAEPEDEETDLDEDIDPDAPFEFPIEDSIDLHPFPPRDIPDVVDAYLESAIEKGFLEIRLIHGRGIGVQRDRVQKLLAKHPFVSGFHDAPADRGGWGATIAYLKSRQD
jgi:hypothetical protein